MSIILKLENLAKRYSKTVWGVKNIGLEVEKNEFLVLLGPSGCGKTTTMRMIAGLEEVTKGSISLEGRDITDIAPRHRSISMVFQNYAIWPHMSVFENIAFSLKLKKIPKKEIEIRVKEAASLVKIADLLERLPGQLSGGQQQRVALARALIVKPKLFLMDEPLSNLDAKLRVTMRTELKAIHQMTGATSIFVTHDQSEAMSMADRIVIMKNGEIVQIGTPEEVYFKSANLFVAGFIGTPPSNFFTVKCCEEGHSFQLIHNHFKFYLMQSEYSELKNYIDKDIILAVRPEDVRISTNENAILKKDILVVEPQGSHQVIAFKLDDNIIKMIAPPELRLKSGDHITISFNLKRIHFFDPISEMRIN